MPRLTIPIKGIADNSTFIDTPDGFAPPGSQINVVPREPGTGRQRLSKRPGLAKVFQTRLGREGNRRIQGIRSLSRAAAVTEFTLGAATAFGFQSAISRMSGLIDFNAFLMNTETMGVVDAFMVEGSGGQATALRNGASTAQNLAAATTGFPNSDTPDWCAVAPSGTLGVLAFNYTVSSQIRTLLVFIDPRSGDVVGSKVIAPSGEDTAAVTNAATVAACWTANALWVGRGPELWYVPTPEIAGAARLIEPDTVSAIRMNGQAEFPLASVASRITGLATVDVGGTVYVVACFKGARGAGYYANPSGAITANGYAEHFRSGLVRFIEVDESDPYRHNLERDTVFGQAPGEFDPYVEVGASGSTTPISHGTIRFSRVLERAPRGCLPTGVACAADGSVAVIFTNQGYGPNSGFTPSGGVRYTTVAKFDEFGALVWEEDAQSSIGGEAGGKLAGVGTTYPTDIPDEDGGNAGTTSKDGPAVRAIAVSQSGVVYVAGRVNAGRFCLFCFDSASGQLRFRTGLESTNAASHDQVTAGEAAHGVPRGGLAIDPADGTLVAVGWRNNTYPSSSIASTAIRPYASVWRVSSVDGSILAAGSPTQDESEAHPFCVACAEGVALVGCGNKTDT